MFKQLIACSFLSLIVFASCQKDMAAKENLINDALSDKNVSAELSLSSVVSSNHWYGEYANRTPADTSDGSPGGGPDILDPTDAEMIHDGVAQVPNLPGWLFFSNISFDIPSQYSIPGDSIVFEAVVKNQKDGGISDYDVALQITGDQHSAEVHFVADTSYKSYTKYNIGDKSYVNISSLVNYFSDFKTIKLVTNKGQTGVYVNNKLAYSFKYTAANRIGRVQTITVAGKGYVAVNSVKLLNSYNNKKILVENFNIDGQSHTVFY